MNKTIAKRLHEIGHALGEYYRRRAQLQIDERITIDALEGQARALTPADGWPGKNEEQRKAAREATLAADETHAAVAVQQRESAKNLTLIGANIEALEAERRALEWQVRCEQIQAFGHYQETPDDTLPPVEEAVQAAVDAGTTCDCGNPKLPNAYVCDACLPFSLRIR